MPNANLAAARTAAAAKRKKQAGQKQAGGKQAGKITGGRNYIPKKMQAVKGSASASVSVEAEVGVKDWSQRRGASDRRSCGHAGADARRRRWRGCGGRP